MNAINLPASAKEAGLGLASDPSSSLALTSPNERLQNESTLRPVDFYSAEDILDNNSAFGLAASSLALQQQQQQQQSATYLHNPSPSDDSFGAGEPAADLLELQRQQQQQQQHNEMDLASIVNVTREYPFDYAIVMFGYLLPFVLVVTIVTNLLVVAVLYQRHMRTPTNIVLFTMAIVDLCTLLSPSPWYLYIYTFGNHNKFLYPPAMCYAHHIMTDVIPVFFHTSSIWLALLLASQRYIYVCHPTLARTWCTVPRVNKAIIWILSIAFIHQIPRFFDNAFESAIIEYNNVQHKACRNSIAWWVEVIDVPLYYGSYFTFRIFFVFIIPCFALLALNLLLFRALKRAENKRCQLLKTKFKLADAEPSERGMNRNFSVTGSFFPGGVSSYNMGAGAGVSGLGGTSSALAGHTIEEGQGSGSRQSSPVSEDTTGQVSPLDPGDLQRPLASDDSPEDRKKLRNPKRVGSKESGQNMPEASDIKTRHSVARTGGGGGWRQQATTTSETQTSIEERGSSSASSASRSGTSSSRTSRTSRSSGSKAGEDHESACAECAAAFRKEEEEAAALREATGLECRGCSTGLEGPLGGARSCQARGLQHQPISQCSSILGGATNTTTNEDMSSSCQATQHVSSSMLVRAAGTLDNIEVAVVNQDEVAGETEQTDVAANEDGEEEELSINCDEEAEEVQGLLEDVSRCPRAGSDTTCLRGGGGGNGGAASADSRLACGCFTAQANALRRVRLLSGAKSKADEVPHNSYSVVECQHGRDLGGGVAVMADNLSEDNRANGSRCAAGPKDRAGQKMKNSTSLSLGFEDRQRQQSNQLVHKQEKQQPRQPQQRHKQASRAALDDCQRQQRAASQCPAQLAGSHLSTAQPSATGTTSTTLYSAHTNSAGSLLQVQQQQSSLGASSGRPNAYQLRMKSPSYASCTTGRGSRATLLGSSAIPMIVSGQSGQQQANSNNNNNNNNNIQATITTSSRTMDSNRTTLMLVVVVTVFLIVEVPVALVTIAHVVIHLFDRFRDVEVQAWLDYVKLFTNFFIMISYSVNFTIYCSMSKKFRETFRDLFFCGRSSRRKRDKRMLYQSQAQQSMYEPYTQVHQFAATASSALAITQNNNNNNNSNIGNHLGLANVMANNVQPGISRAPATAVSNGKSTPDGYKPRLSSAPVTVGRPLDCEV